MSTRDGSKQARSIVAAALTVGVLAVGLAVSTITATTAVRMGEVPVTVVPFGQQIVALGVLPLVASRLLVVVVGYLLAKRYTPRYRLPVVAAISLGWLLLGVWQGWVLLALT